MDQGMTLEQRQTLHLTPQMRQSIKILQMDVIELSQWLERESQDNPVLDVELNQMIEKDRAFNRARYEEKDLQKSNINDKTNWENWEEEQSFFSYYSDRRGVKRNISLVTEQEKDYQYFVSRDTTLHEHLLLCWKLIAKNTIDYKIGEYLIGNINQNGYLGISCLEAARDLSIPEKRARQVLAMIQNCSIPGLGARNLKECLLLQLKYLNLGKKDIIRKLILFYLTELSQKKFNKICKTLNLSYYDIQCLLDIIVKNFDPKPGRIFCQNSELIILMPDIIVKKIDDKYEIIENKSCFPSIKINSLYKNILLKDKVEKDAENREYLSAGKGNEHQKTLEYLEKKMKAAHWIIRCVEQRRKTIFDITRFIIDYQREFLEKGITHLKPLSMKKVADLLDLHESTVSRAISKKRIQLPRGIYDMKYFFSKGLAQEKNEVVSNEKIKSLIRKYVEGENHYFPYSDQKLTELLQKRENLKMARRTVTKYRRLLGLAPAKMRRRYKK